MPNKIRRTLRSSKTQQNSSGHKEKDNEAQDKGDVHVGQIHENCDSIHAQAHRTKILVILMAMCNQ